MLNTNQLEKIINESNRTKLICRVDKLGASSQRKTFVCENEKVKYKIRKCFSSNDAKELERKILDLCHLDFFPNYLGRYNEYIFLEYLNLPEAKRVESDKFWYKLGKNIAEIEKVSSGKVDVGFGMETLAIPESNFSMYIHLSVEELFKTGYIDKNQTRKLQEEVDHVLEKNPRYCYGYLDLLPGNILLHDEKAILVDEEGIAQTIQGLSLIRPLDIWKKYVPPKGINSKEKENLMKGYQDGGANREFFEKNELQIALIYYVLKSIDSIKCTGKTNNSIKQLYSRLEKV